MKTFELILGILFVLGSLYLRLFWWSSYPWLSRYSLIFYLVKRLIVVALLIGGVLLIITSLTH